MKYLEGQETENCIEGLTQDLFLDALGSFTEARGYAKECFETVFGTISTCEHVFTKT